MISWSVYRCYCGSVFCPSATFSLQPFCAHIAGIYPSSLRISITFKTSWKGACLGWKCFLYSGLLFISVPVPRSLVKNSQVFIEHLLCFEYDPGCWGLYVCVCVCVYTYIHIYIHTCRDATEKPREQSYHKEATGRGKITVEWRLGSGTLRPTPAATSPAPTLLFLWFNIC